MHLSRKQKVGRNSLPQSILLLPSYVYDIRAFWWCQQILQRQQAIIGIPGCLKHSKELILCWTDKWVPVECQPSNSAVSVKLTWVLQEYKKLGSVWFTDHEFRTSDLPQFYLLDSQWQYRTEKKPVFRHRRAAGGLPVLQFLWGAWLKQYHNCILPCSYFSKGIELDKEPRDKL